MNNCIAALAACATKPATRAQMERRGYVYDESNPDLRVNIMLAVQQRAEVRSAPGAGPLPYRTWRASNIEIVDTQRRAMVWRGVAPDRITPRDTMRELFARYPREA